MRRCENFGGIDANLFAYAARVSMSLLAQRPNKPLPMLDHRFGGVYYGTAVASGKHRDMILRVGMSD